ncbi:hypothetical protein GQ44DRAFT_716432 [Phaeosphaeriaceae sp. PMI808]|nr:hypothetical protein GQ44DRAFT_716432 [Phaeosphaeriaceae sp. PMI808]
MPRLMLIQQCIYLYIQNMQNVKNKYMMMFYQSEKVLDNNPLLKVAKAKRYLRYNYASSPLLA